MSDKQRYFIELAYNGTKYHGWQVQPNAKTIQADIEHALSTMCRECIAVVGCGRTDTGVHASYYVAHFDAMNGQLDDSNFIYKLNSFLSKDIVVYSIQKVSDDAHARFGAVERTYNYFINIQKNPFTQDGSWYYNKSLNVEEMNRVASLLLNYQDFTSFSKLHTDVKTNNCDVKFAQWQQFGTSLCFTVTADRFLRNMVRAIVGTLIEIGEGKKNEADFIQIIEAKNRAHAGRSVPAHALFLTDIKYPSTLFKRTVEKVNQQRH